jgi:hypothetical protein
MSETPKVYADRDHRALGEHYYRHISAMTGEELHAKTAIAAELAWRDAQIEAVTRERDEARAEAASILAELEEQKETAQAESDRWREIAYEELEATLTLMAIGGAGEEENFYDFATRVFKERDALRAEVDKMRETLTGIRDADWRKWEELASPDEFVAWAKRRAYAALTPAEVTKT